MPKEKIYDGPDGIEVQWAKDGQLICIVINEQVDDVTIGPDGAEHDPRTEHLMTMWQATDPQQIDKLIANLQRARRSAWH